MNRTYLSVMSVISGCTVAQSVVAVVVLLVVMSGQRAQAQPGTVLSHQKISSTQGGGPPLDNGDQFCTTASLGDLDGDGVGDLAVGAYGDDDGGSGRGAVWILFLNTDGTVKSYQKISDTEGGFTGILDNGDRFGWHVASLGDLDGDGPSVLALAVGAQGDDDGCMPAECQRGAVWILFLNDDGTVSSHTKISDTEGGFTGILDDSDWFGYYQASLGDLDGDGVGDLAVGAPADGDGGNARGAVWILFLNANGTVKSYAKISNTQGGFTGSLDDFDNFGESVAAMGDFDGDGVVDLAVGAYLDDDGCEVNDCERGALWILFLNTDGTVKSHQKISDTQGGFTGILDDDDWFSITPSFLGDLNGDGVGDLAVGANNDDDGGTNRGAVWILFLDGVVKSPCPWDLDSSGAVGTGDLLALFAQWGTDGPADFDGSGTVGTGDLLILFANWGPCE